MAPRPPTREGLGLSEVPRAGRIGHIYLPRRAGEIGREGKAEDKEPR